MADGNFHNSPLPRNDYASGVRAGEARMKARLFKAIEEYSVEGIKGNTSSEWHANLLRYLRETLVCVLLLVGTMSISAYNGYDYVNPLMGTDSDFSMSHGNTYPAISRPWGMNFWTPQTSKDNFDGWQYTYAAQKIYGFKQTHQPSPWMGDYAHFSIMPYGATILEDSVRGSYFSHKTETVRPNYYKVYLADSNIWAELTATERCAMMRFSTVQHVVIDLHEREGQPSKFTLVNEAEGVVEGWVSNNSGGVTEDFKNYFHISFSGPIYKLSEKNGVLVVACYGDELQVSSSFLDIQTARLSLQREIGDKMFDEVVEEGAQLWNKELARVVTPLGALNDVEKRKTFYSCLYRCLLFPRMLYEFDAQGNKVHRDPNTGNINIGPYYTDTGFWDTFRGLMPLVETFYPERAEEMYQGLLSCYRESGYFPEWASPGHRDCMIGNNSASVLVAHALKKAKNESSLAQNKTLCDELTNLYYALFKNRSQYLKGTASGRKGYEYYNQLGYVPNDVGINESAARTLEYAYDDYCIWELAKLLRDAKVLKSKAFLAEVAMLEKASHNWQNVFNPQYGLAQGRAKDGSFQEKFSPYKWGGDFTEGNSLHYSWSVFHDIPGLINAMGSVGQFEYTLDKIMTLPPVYDDSYYGFCIHEIREMQVMGFGQYAHGNQPIQHMLWLYDYTEHPEKTKYWVNEIMTRLYQPTPDGYCGDEDNGQTSAWYVWATLGCYPVCPVDFEYKEK